ncbi:MAG TPA: DUF1232 domain-containing protein [Peptococcaceae bacterium]|nr:DUF1232 domain-containing protein [Peptococcaceae bacterium]
MQERSNEPEKQFSPPEDLIGDQEIDKWKVKAAKYIDDPKRTENLLSRAWQKAENAKNSQVIDAIWDKIQLLFSLVRDWANGNYKGISKSAIIAVIAGLIYFVSPLDVIPDFLVGLGIVDDAAVLALIIKQIDKEIIRYKQWKSI